jgi:hypothetical protein
MVVGRSNMCDVDLRPIMHDVDLHFGLSAPRPVWELVSELGPDYGKCTGSFSLSTAYAALRGRTRTHLSEESLRKENLSEQNGQYSCSLSTERRGRNQKPVRLHDTDA